MNSVLIHRQAIYALSLATLTGITFMGCGEPRVPSRDDQSGKKERSATPATRKEQLLTAVEKGDWADAEGLARAAILENPDDVEVLKIAAVVAGKNGHRKEAASLATDAVKATSTLDPSLVSLAVRAHLEAGQLYEAIDLLQWTVQQYPEASGIQRTLVGFLGDAQLTDEIPVHLPHLIRDRQFDAWLLIAATDISFRLFDNSAIEMMRERNPTDYRLRLAKGKSEFDASDYSAAADTFSEIVAHQPDFLPAFALLARTLAASGRWEDLRECLVDAPAGLGDHPNYLIAIGDEAYKDDDFEGAVHAYAQASHLRPTDSTAWARLASAMRLWRETTRGDGDESPAAPSTDWDSVIQAVEQRVVDLFELGEHFFAFSGTEARSQSEAVKVAASLLNLGRHWEAEAWSAVALTLTNDPSEDVGIVRENALKALSADPILQSVRNHPEMTFDLSQFRPTSDQPKQASTQPSAGSRADVDPLPIQLQEQSAAWSLIFQGKIGNRVEGPYVPIAQSTGCGGGAIDYDRDGRFDLMLMSAGGTAGERDSEQDAMLRNVGGKFVNATAASQCGDAGFGQGVAVGDFNDDGFPDLYLLNLGENRLLRNNGDGTFTNVTTEVGLGGDAQWSTSGAIVDIDGDGYCDLISVNYCDAKSPVNEPCYDPASGNEKLCHPLGFRGALDQFLRGQPDGQFVDVTKKWTADVSPRRGLGVLAGKLDGQTMSLFIANDASANHFWLATEPGSGFRLREAATASGVAADGRGLPQGSMGMAVGDFDRDKDLDFLVTATAGEYNAYYRQDFPGVWTDRTAMVNLVDSSIQKVGFGTQAVDFDCDGWDELMVTNGHIADLDGDERPYAQPIQLFRRNETGQFQSVDMQSWGEYFSSPHVGRALWLVDVDSDSRSDVIVTHSTEPVALLINKSETYHNITLELVATSATRDAIGAQVNFVVPNPADSPQSTTETRVVQRSAGSGYMVSNEPVLRIGIGPAKAIRSVSVTWPDGEVQRFGDLSANSHYLLIEGEKAPFRLGSPGATNR